MARSVFFNDAYHDVCECPDPLPDFHGDKCMRCGGEIFDEPNELDDLDLDDDRS